MTTPSRAFLAIKWGPEFDPDDLNTLKRAALAQTSFPVRFICLTDDATGLDEDIETHPIPVFDLYDGLPRAAIWPKISLFHPDIAGYADLVVFLDIDTVVCGSLDDLFDDPNGALRVLGCGDRWRKLDDSIAAETATGVMTYRPSLQTHIFDAFVADKNGAANTYPLEQEFVGAVARQIEFYPVRWVQSFKYHLRRPPVIDLFLASKDPHPDSRLVAFHGFPRPRNVADPSMAWAPGLRSGRHRPRWICDYFDTFSDRRSLR